MEERLRTEFNEWARAGRGESMERVHQPTGAQAIERMRVPADACVLDVGCGNGWATRLLAEDARQGRVVGIDISDEMIRGARAASASIENVEFRVASAEHLPFDDDTFTHAFSMESLYYYADMEAALKEIRRVLARDERLYNPVSVPEDYSGGSFKTREDYLQYLAAGSLMMSGRVRA